MNPLSRLRASAVLACAFAFSLNAQAQVTVSEAWVRATVAQQHASGAFMHLATTEPVRLVGARASVAARTELHEMKMIDDVMRMRALAAIEITPQQGLTLAPGGYHLMLQDLKQPLTAGSRVPITLTFETKGGRRFELDVPATVRALNSGNANHEAHHH